MSRPESICNHHLFRELVGPTSIVLDLGAYEGEFSREISQGTGAYVLAIEASPLMFENMYASERIEKLNLAVGDHEGISDLYLGSNPLGTSVYADHPSSGTQRVAVRTTTLPRLISDHCKGSLDLLKVNIEGAEIPMFSATDDLTLQKIQQITIQFHDFIPELDQAADVMKVKERLRRLGFGEIIFKTPNKDVLFVNLRAGALSRRRFVAEKLLVQMRQYLRAARKKVSGVSAP